MSGTGPIHRRSRLIAAALCVFGVFATQAADYQFIYPSDGIEAVKGLVDPRPSPTIPLRGRTPAAPFGQGYAGEVEPNGTTATATPITGTNIVLRAPLFPNGDVDFFSFNATAGDRVYAATMTSFSAGSSTDSQLRIFAPDGTTEIEFDDDNGSFAGLSSGIAGALITTTGTHFIRVNDFTAGTTSELPYELHLRIQSAAPTPEVEANDTPATANPLPASGHVSGARNPAAGTEQDWYSFTANAGDTVYLSLDVDPEDDLVVWNGRLGIALFGDAANQILVVDDAGTGDIAPNPNRPSESLFFTVKTSGTYFAFVDSATAATGGPTATYNLSVSIHPATPEGLNCTTYTSTNVPQTIGPGTSLVSSTITVPGNPIIADLDVDIVLNHALMQDIDAHLRSPAGNDNGLFTDIGAAAVGGQTQMDVVFDDEAGIPPAFTALRNTQLKPEVAYRLGWFDGENAGGTWTLDLRDDTANANGGTLTAWSLRICEAPPPPTCPVGTVQTTAFSTDFESGAAGFTHSGAADEWELGLPATVATTTANPVAAFNTCASGVNCWKTDLDNTYDVSSNQDLLSAPINLAGLQAPITVNWSHRYQMESANFDHYNVTARQVGTPANAVRLFEFLDATMTNPPGNPAVQVGASAGWGRQSVRADSLAGLNTELLFHVDSDTTASFGGAAIDDVSVTGCRPLSADLSITKTDGVTTAVPGGSVTYTITASNAGADPVASATVADTFPAILTCTWTCVGAGGGTCTAAGSGNINDTVNLPAGGSTTFTATCAINASATGTLVNTATVSSSVTDPDPANNSATDTDTLTPQADLSITKTDGVTTAVPGASVTYTITASNAGQSDAPGATVADTFPASLTCTWTCAGAGGGTCTAAGSGNISDTVNLPAGGSVTYSATCAISATATGSLTNTATVTAPAGVTETNPANNSATDTDTLTPTGDLSITKTDGQTTVTPGATLTYTIVAANSGPSTLNATVADTQPTECTSFAWTCVAAGGATCAANGTGSINDAAVLPASGSATYTVTCPLNVAVTNATISNTATITAAGATDPTPGNETATDTTQVLGTPDVTGTKTVTGTFFQGGNIVYTIVLTNNGTSAQADNTGDEFVDVLPAQVAGGTPTATAGTVTIAAGTVRWNGTIAAGASVTITIPATISATASGVITNQGTINVDLDGNGTNETARLTDDPGLVGVDQATGFGVAAPVPMIGRFGMILLALGLLGFAMTRQRLTA